MALGGPTPYLETLCCFFSSVCYPLVYHSGFSFHFYVNSGGPVLIVGILYFLFYFSWLMNKITMVPKCFSPVDILMTQDLIMLVPFLTKTSDKVTLNRNCGILGRFI